MDSASCPPPPVTPDEPTESAELAGLADLPQSGEELTVADEIPADVPTEPPKPQYTAPVSSMVADETDVDQSFEIPHGDHPIIKPSSPEQANPAGPLVSTEPVTVASPGTLAATPEAEVELSSLPVENSSQVSNINQLSEATQPEAAVLPTFDEPQTLQAEPEQPQVQAKTENSVQSSAEPISQPVNQPEESFDMLAEVAPSTTAHKYESQTLPAINQPVGNFATPLPVEQSLQFVEQNPNQNLNQSPNLIQPIVQVQSPGQTQNYSQPQPDSYQSQTVPTDLQAQQMQPPASNQAPPQPESKNKKLLIVLASLGGIIMLVVAAFIVKALFFNTQITASDITEASNILKKTTDNIYSVEGDLITLAGASEIKTIKTTYDDAQSKAKQADADYLTLTKLKILKQPQVRSKYQELDAKWKPYMSFISDNLNDINNLKLGIVAVNDKLNSASKNGSADISIQTLNNYKSALDKGEDDIKKINLKTKSNKTIQSAYIKYLDDSATMCATTIKKVKAGNIVAGLDCLLGTDKISKDYSDGLHKSDEEFISEDEKLSVSYQMTALDSSITNLLSDTQD